MPGREPLPVGTSTDDVVAAIQAAWLAENYAFVRELIERYLDATPPRRVCFRCVKSFTSRGLYEFRPASGLQIRLCSDCWHNSEHRTQGGLGPAITLGALIRDRYGDSNGLSMLIEPDAYAAPDTYAEPRAVDN